MLYTQIVGRIGVDVVRTREFDRDAKRIWTSRELTEVIRQTGEVSRFRGTSGSGLHKTRVGASDDFSPGGVCQEREGRLDGGGVEVVEEIRGEFARDQMKSTFDGLMRALEEVKSHAQGERELPIVRVEFDAPDVREIRKGLKLSQVKFAGLFGFSLPAVRAWEQGKRQPDISARHYLRVIERNPAAVVEALRV